MARVRASGNFAAWQTFSIDGQGNLHRTATIVDAQGTQRGVELPHDGLWDIDSTGTLAVVDADGSSPDYQSVIIDRPDGTTSVVPLAAEGGVRLVAGTIAIQRSPKSAPGVREIWQYRLADSTAARRARFAEAAQAQTWDLDRHRLVWADRSCGRVIIRLARIRHLSPHKRRCPA